VNDSLTILAAGLGGVFLGMTLLYLAMHATARVIGWIESRRSHDA